MIFLDIILVLSLFIIMLGVGLSIKLKEFSNELKKPKEIILGLVLQLLFYPLITFLIIEQAPINVIWKTGFLILAICPAGALANLITNLLKGKTVLSVEITAIGSFISLLTLPLYAGIAIKYYLGDVVQIALPFGQLIFYLLMVTTIPAIFGSIVAHKKPEFANKINKIVKIIGGILFLIIILLKFFFGEGGHPMPKSHVMPILLWAIIINITTIFFAYLFSKLLGFTKNIQIAFASQMGIQNTTFTLIITDTILKYPAFGEPAIIYSIISFPITLLTTYILKKYTK